MADEALGPISYLVVQFPGNKMTGEGFPILVDLVDRGLIRILDLLFATRDEDGSIRAVKLNDIDRDGRMDLAVFEGASSGLLDDSDLTDAASVIDPGSSAGILIFENRWATPFSPEVPAASAICTIPRPVKSSGAIFPPSSVSRFSSPRLTVFRRDMKRFCRAITDGWRRSR